MVASLERGRERERERERERTERGRAGRERKDLRGRRLGRESARKEKIELTIFTVLTFYAQSSTPLTDVR